MSSPSIIPNYRLDRDFYLVREDFRGGAAFCEADEGITYISLNPVEGWSMDASEDIAGALEAHTLQPKAAKSRKASGISLRAS
jgi:hypothetical protein